MHHLLCSFSLLLFALVAVHASHYRYGTISWTASQTTVTFTLETAWRRSYFTPLPNVNDRVSFGSFFFGDERSSVGANVTATVTTINPLEDWFICISQFSHTYKSANNSGNPWNARFTGTARINALLNNAGQPWNLITTVDCNAGSSPVSKMLPIANVLYVQNYIVSFQIPAVSDDAQVHYSLGSSTQICGQAGCTNPSNLAVDPVTGVVTWNLQNVKPGLWCAVIIIATDSVYVPVDFILNYTQVAGSCSSNCTKSGVTCTVPADCGQCTATNDPCMKPLPPVFIAPTPSPNVTVPVSAGSMLSFIITAMSPQSSFAVTIQESTIPQGASVGPNVGTNPATRTFTWTPTTSQSGDYIVCFSATDNHSFSSAQYCITIEVSVGCEPACQGNSQCVTNMCECFPGYSGANCTIFGGEISTPGEPIFGTVLMHNYNWYSFYKATNDTIKIVLETLDDGFDTALYVSTIYSTPNITHNTWDSISNNPNTIAIPDTDPNFVLGTYYVGVEGWYGPFGQTIDYNITIYF